MLAIRLQRTGRGGHSQFRVIVQDSRFSPKRGRIVAYLGNYDPHTKTATFDSQKAAQYLENGAQPSERVARLLQKEGVKLPAWVKLSEPQKRSVRHPEKRRSTRPADTETPAAPAAAATEETSESAAATTPETPAETPSEEPVAVEQTETEASTETPSEEPAPAVPAAEPEPSAEESPAEPAAEKPTQDKTE